MPASDYQYWYGKETTDLKAVSKRGIPRRDAYDKVSSKAEFGGDVKLPGMLYARMLHCPYAHARIKSMDTSEAEKLPGVRVVLRYDDPIVPKRLWCPWDSDLQSMVYERVIGAPFYILGDEAWHYNTVMGVAIAAEDWDIAEEAISLIKVEWEELPFVVDIEKALEADSPLAYSFMFDPEGPMFDKKWEPDKLRLPGNVYYNETMVT